MIKREFWQGDCLELMREIPDGSVDMVLCDLPYQVTNNSWDTIIPFAPLWRHYERVTKCNGAIVLTAQQPFTTQLITSNISKFRYSLVWDKKGTTGFQQAKRRPLRRHEDVLVFYKKQPTYNPEMEERGKPRKKGGSKVDNGNYGELRSTESFNNLYYPTSIIEVTNASKRNLIHPTQKPVALFEYLIKTYTHPGETVLDNCAGSGTTAIAALNTGRGYICIEKDPEYYRLATERVSNHAETLKERLI